MAENILEPWLKIYQNHGLGHTRTVWKYTFYNNGISVGKMTIFITKLTNHLAKCGKDLSVYGNGRNDLLYGNRRAKRYLQQTLE